MVHLFCGVDSHKDTLAACLVDQTGRQLAAAGFANTPAGHRQLAAWLDRHGPIARVGVEGGANLGAALARFLHHQGVDVREVPCALTVRERRRLRRLASPTPPTRWRSPVSALATTTCRQLARPGWLRT